MTVQWNARGKRWPRVALATAVVFAAAGVGFVVWCGRGYGEARRFASHGLWTEAHAAAGRYLLLHPRDVEANLLCAEALAKDERMPLEVRVGDAVRCLRRIPDDDPRGGEARKAEARVLLFLWRDAFAAERSLARTLAKDPDDVEAHYLAWKVLTLTRRHEDAERHFLAVLRATPVKEQGAVLREWYFSQFYPVTATTDLDGMMGFRATPADKATEVESNRLFAFRGADPLDPLANAAMARWFVSEEADLPFALDLLDGAMAARPEESRRQPFFMATLVDVLVDLGEMERAGREFDTWPPAEESRDYWLARGRVEDEVRGDPAAAAAAYEKALAMWPGEIDWRTMNRAATCHARAGDQERAAALRARGGELERLLEEKTQARLRAALVRLDNPEGLREVADFYETIRRPVEAAAWARFTDRLGGDATDGGGKAPNEGADRNGSP